MSSPESEPTKKELVELDVAFIGLVGDELASHHYLQTCPAIMTALETQAALRECRWKTKAEANLILEGIIGDLDSRAVGDGIMNEFAVLSGGTLVLPAAEISEDAKTTVIRQNTTPDDETLERFMMGVAGPFNGFYFVLSDNEDSTISARLVYQVIVGHANTANSMTTLCASAEVDHMTTLDFIHDRIFRELRERAKVFHRTQDQEVMNYFGELDTLTRNASGDYTAEELNRISVIVQKLSVHDALSDSRQEVVDSLEAVVLTNMVPRLARQPLGISHTAGLYKQVDSEVGMQLSPYRQDPMLPPFSLEPTNIYEMTVMPTYQEKTVDNSNTAMSYEPYMIIRSGQETRYVPLSRITAVGVSSH